VRDEAWAPVSDSSSLRAAAVPVAIAALTAASYAVGWFLFVPLAVPLFNTAASYPFMVASLRRGALQVAVARMLVWALAMGTTAMLLSFARPAETDRLFVHGEAYRIEMHTWVMRGRGAQSTPSVFIPQQIEHAVLFSILALATAGVVAMIMGAVLMNYMGHYVGTLAAIGRRPALLMILGWHPWSVIRIVSFVVLGVALSTPIVARKRPDIRWVAWAIGGLAADIVLKALLAPAWQRVLVKLI
jgi:hypothetical protein